MDPDNCCSLRCVANAQKFAPWHPTNVGAAHSTSPNISVKTAESDSTPLPVEDKSCNAPMVALSFSASFSYRFE